MTEPDTARTKRRAAYRPAPLHLHGTGGTGHQFLNPNFAGPLFGPGEPLDISRYYIILPDNIGHGKSSKPSDGLHAHFPHYGYHDMIHAQYDLLTRHLGVNHLRLVMGTSMGGMHSWMWPVAAGPELPQRHGARSQGQNREIRNGGSLPGSDSREGARSKRRKAAAGDGEGAYMDVRDRAGFGENAAPRRLSPRPAPQMYPSFMDAAMPLASLPVQIAGRNRYFRRMVTDSIKDSPDYDGGEYKHPPLGLRGAFYALAFMTSSPKDWQREMPTQALADAGFDRMLARDFRAYDATRGGRAVGTVGQVGAEGCEIHAVADRPRQTTRRGPARVGLKGSPARSSVKRAEWRSHSGSRAHQSTCCTSSPPPATTTPSPSWPGFSAG